MEEESRDVLFKLYGYITLANEGLELFSPSIDRQLCLMQSSDQVEETEENSLGFSISEKLNALDGHFISDRLKTGLLDEFLSNELDGRFSYAEGKITSNLKKSGTFNDLERGELSVEHILSMSDITFLSEMNAYQNPYSGHKQGRTMYEHFFSSLINYVFKPVSDFNESSQEFINFQIIHETMYILHLVSQNSVSIIETIMAIVKVVNVRIKTSGLSIRMDLRLPEFKNPIIENSMEIFAEGSKIYEAFRNKNFGSTISRLSEEEHTWLSKIIKFHDILGSTLETAHAQANTVFDNVVALKNMLVSCKESFIELEIYISDLMLFVVEFQSFVSIFTREKDGYPKYYRNVYLLLGELEKLEEDYPTVYGGYTTPSPRTPRNQPSARQTVHTRPRGKSAGSKSKEGSPRVSPHKKEEIVKAPRASVEMKLDLTKVKSGCP